MTTTFAPPLPRLTAVRAPVLQRCGGRQCPPGICSHHDQPALLQRRHTTHGAPMTAPPVVNEVLRSPGQPLDPATRTFMKSRFGHDFAHVRIHTDARAADSAVAVNALAYTVGHHVVFGEGHYSPETREGRLLLAHELAHVVQQVPGDGDGTPRISRHPGGEVEADHAAECVVAGGDVRVAREAHGHDLRLAPGDRVEYSGGTSGTLKVVQGGSTIFTTTAVSGHPGSKEFEKGVGPIPAGGYMLHPGVTQPTVTMPQNGVCGASRISSGYQEITSTDPQPCDDPTNHYCTVPCPTPADSGQRCFTPRDCWGAKRIKIEGSGRAPMPTGGVVTRSGFYIHGGNHSVAVTSGCIKVFDDAAFDEIRKLTGAVPLCVGAACVPGGTP